MVQEEGVEEERGADVPETGTFWWDFFVLCCLAHLSVSGDRSQEVKFCSELP